MLSVTHFIFVWRVMTSKARDLTGHRFEKLTVKLRAANNGRRVMWECLCDPKYGGCGNITYVEAGCLREGRTRSCGCLRTETNKDRATHGLSHLGEYRIWGNIKTRCYNKNDVGYSEYGGRGIDMCDEWRDDFAAFYRDMGPRPSLEHSIDRKDNEKGYSKDNCRWATKIEQQNNRRNNLLYELDGVTKTLAEWCRDLGLNYKVIHDRLQKQGQTFKEAIEGA